MIIAAKTSVEATATTTTATANPATVMKNFLNSNNSYSNMLLI